MGRVAVAAATGVAEEREKKTTRMLHSSSTDGRYVEFLSMVYNNDVMDWSDDQKDPRDEKWNEETRLVCVYACVCVCMCFFCVCGCIMGSLYC